MGKKVDPYECQVAQSLRDEAVEYVGELFPKARVSIQLSTGESGVGVVARIIGDPAPHASEEIKDCLGQLGVHDVSLIQPESQARPLL
jgi:hypothetical protein